MAMEAASDRWMTLDIIRRRKYRNCGTTIPVLFGEVKGQTDFFTPETEEPDGKGLLKKGAASSAPTKPFHENRMNRHL
jgi:hypothetical protein